MVEKLEGSMCLIYFIQFLTKYNLKFGEREQID